MKTQLNNPNPGEDWKNPGYNMNNPGDVVIGTTVSIMIIDFLVVLYSALVAFSFYQELKGPNVNDGGHAMDKLSTTQFDRNT